MGKFDFLKKAFNGNGKIIVPESNKRLNVFVAVCCHRGVDPDVVDQLIVLAKCVNPFFAIKMKGGDALISRSRNVAATRFLEALDYDVLLFIDDDVIFNPKDAVQVARLCNEQNLGIVGGAYVKKSEERTHYAIKTCANYEYIFGKGGNCEEVEYVSTGFMAIQKRVLQQMTKEIPEGQNFSYCTNAQLNYFTFFDPFSKLVDGKWLPLSEDWAFCERWKQLGGKIYCDNTIRLKHAGRYLYEDKDMLRPVKPDFDSFKYFDDGQGHLQVSGIPKQEAEAVLSGSEVKGA